MIRWKSGGRFSTKELSSFLYPAQSLSTIFDSINIARLDLAVFSNAEDVKPEDVNRDDNEGYDTSPAFSETGQLAWLQMKREGYESDKNDIIVMIEKIIEGSKHIAGNIILRYHMILFN